MSTTLPMAYNYGYKKLIVFQKAKLLALQVYRLTNSFPKSEQFVLIPQMRRAALSVAANVVEGYAKNSRKDFARFLGISIGSTTELELFLEISFELGYIKAPDFDKIHSLLLEVKKLLYSFQKGLRGVRKN